MKTGLERSKLRQQILTFILDHSRSYSATKVRQVRGQPLRWTRTSSPLSVVNNSQQEKTVLKINLLVLKYDNKKNENVEIAIFLHFYVHLLVSQIFCGIFLWNLASIINKRPNILTKRPLVATTVPYGSNTVIGAFGIPWYTYLRIYDPGPSNPTTFLGLCSLVTTGNLWSFRLASLSSTQ